VDEVSLRELRNNVSAILRRVQAGERFRVTVNRRPVAELVPLPHRRLSVPWDEVRAKLPAVQADAGLTADLLAAAPETSDDV
jgi:prevent-host-death family protein